MSTHTILFSNNRQIPSLPVPLVWSYDFYDMVFWHKVTATSYDKIIYIPNANRTHPEKANSKTSAPITF